MSYAIGDAKRFLKNKINFIIIIGICILINQFILMGLLVNGTSNIIKKINHRYFNIVKTIEDIHKVNIDTLDGSIK